MTDKLGELSVDPKAAAAIQRWLLPGERILWAARRTRIGRRDLYDLCLAMAPMAAAIALIFWLGWSAFFAIVPALWLLVGRLMLPRIWFWRFAVTTHGVVIANSFWPRGAMGWSAKALDKHWIAQGRGTGKIEFSGIGADRGGGFMISTRRHRGFIDNIPDIEAVRDLILRRLAASEARQSAATPIA